MPTTEIAIIPLVDGSNINDANNGAAIAVKECFDTVSEQADGVQQYYLGMQIEDPSMLVAMIDWDNAEKHQAWMKHPEYGPVNERIGAIFAAAGKVLHADFFPSGHLDKTIAAPVTEIALFYFDGAPPEDYIVGFVKALSILDKENDIISAAAGITHEELEYEGVKGKAAVVIFGWTSVDAHVAFRQTQTYKDNIGVLMRTAKKFEVKHVNFRK
ncbi:hypothetical protein BD626DRAFT_473446 [Schizophyllum amplum]|uniref:ABM domain-containing protein n=1 Tax=Schizophyllum amplum TaxID=97359 RepID=A0A550CWS7_9AGAR|nr:hypothetical protein BD626DRAFT_473446 [Auriculariopsis ampla]